MSAASVAVVGHVHHGKSSILGRFLLDIGAVPEAHLSATKRFLIEQGLDDSSLYALLVHRNPQEKILEHTELPSWARIEAEGQEVVLIDTPGHAAYHKNMIHGIFQADAAVLVVQAKRGIEEQTRDVLSLLRCFETRLLGVSISRMDEVQYSEETFRERVEQVSELLRESFLDSTVPFFPSSALEGEGVTSYSKAERSMGAPTFFDLVKQLPQASREAAREPTRFVFRRAEIYSPKGSGQVAVGVLEAGVLRVGDELILEPASTLLQKEALLRVRTIQTVRARGAKAASKLQGAEAREILGVAFDTPGWELSRFLSLFNVHGFVAGPPTNRPGVAESFDAEIVVTEYPTAIAQGIKPTFNINGDQVVGSMSDFHSRRRQGGEWEREFDSLLRNGDQARIRVTLDRPVAIERNLSASRLSKFVVRDNRRIVALGSGLVSREASAWSPSGEQAV